ncbi:PREDICTED: uncharacterized protein LOC109184333 [Ipomoea nil]|uniref:uncharacterized protein LOC109184333 n=1 Tax=Ipomoea nil TaxID=35883 RepID=UPI000901C92D|nr:PREDICTED: uncharacterized protein LOC109184333 [Ipomoea nil]
MVSEHGRHSYAAAVSGTNDATISGTSDVNQTTQADPPISESPASTVPGTILQRNQVNQQRSLNVEELENPLILGINDNPSAVLVSPPLVGSSNYGTWCVSMRIALEIKNKWSLIDGSITSLSREHPQYLAWRRCNLLVCSWLFKAVHPSIAQSLMHLDKGREIWEDLRRRFSHCDAQRISILQNEIYNMKQGLMSVSDYYTKSRTLWEEMNTLRPLPICKCNPRCACDLVDEIRKERDVDQVIRFLQGLNDDYNSLKSNILVLDPLPEVYKVYVMAEKLERQISLTILNLGNLDPNLSNAVQSNESFAGEGAVTAALNAYNGRRNNVARPKCTFCGMVGHTVDKCYKKHGYPPGWVPGYKSKGKQVNAAIANDVGDLGITTDQL